MPHPLRGRLPTLIGPESADDARGHRRWPAQREEKLRDISHRITATLRIELERHLSRDVDAARADRLERRTKLLDSLIEDVVFINSTARFAPCTSTARPQS